MTVRELIHELLAYSMDDEVIVTQYDGGSYVNHVRADTVKKGRFVPDVGVSGRAYASGSFIESEYLSPVGFDGAPAVIITATD